MSVDLTKGATVELVKTLSDDLRTRSDGTKAESAGAEIRELKREISQNGGLTATVKEALLACFRAVVFKDDTGAYDALYNALYPPANLKSISAVYTQSGSVYEGDSLDTLKKDLVVTALYDNGTSQIVTTYTLGGSLTQGTSTITVTYGEKTATFNVTVTAVPDRITQDGGLVYIMKASATKTGNTLSFS